MFPVLFSVAKNMPIVGDVLSAFDSKEPPKSSTRNYRKRPASDTRRGYSSREEYMSEQASEDAYGSRDRSRTEF